jgi:hypothetical protein
MVVGFHNEYCLINPSIRKLEISGRELAGQKRINVFENVKEGEVIKVPFYVDRNGSCGIIIIGLVYEINQREIEVACYYLVPAEKGDDVSDSMLIGTGLGSLHEMTPIFTQDRPTLISNPSLTQWSTTAISNLPRQTSSTSQQRARTPKAAKWSTRKPSHERRKS